jgi:Tfp pilus assembly protein PilX
MISRLPPTLRARSEDGFTMIIALGVMLVTSLLLVAAFTAANGDTHLSHQDTLQKQAYYAALAGVQEYEYQLQNNPNYWQNCSNTPANLVPQRSDERYEIKLLLANGKSTCNSEKPFESLIESTGAEANTFRIESIGCAGKTAMATCSGQPKSTVATRTAIATFQVTGFLQYVYFTQYETRDPALYNPKGNCSQYRAQRPSECTTIYFVSGDNVNGPMHTDDTAAICGTPEFGRAGHTPKDMVEINKGVTYEGCGGGSAPKYNSPTGTYSVGEELVAPEQDTSLGAYVEPNNSFGGVTQLVLNGTTNKITVINKGVEKTVSWPENGLIYVEGGGSACAYNFTGSAADGAAEKEKETNCANVYVHGTYSKSLTIAAENDVIVNGSTYPTSVAGKLGIEPSGTAVLGLIATHFVRIYHPVGATYAANRGSCKSGDTYNSATKVCEYENSKDGCNAPDLSAAEDTTNGWGTQQNIWLYAAILSTSHSFAVDNYNCGSELGELNVYGAVAQKFRGIVGTSGSTGYIKNYNYDQRLATDEPPYFLAPLKAGWKVARLTAPEKG